MFVDSHFISYIGRNMILKKIPDDLTWHWKLPKAALLVGHLLKLVL
jgi:hypothetical protein